MLLRTILILTGFAACSGPKLQTSLQEGEAVVIEAKKAPTKISDKSADKFDPQGLPKKLLLSLDGIDFDHFKKMQDGGYFRSFKPVAPMVATFPSISDPNWAKILRTPLEISFTKQHFDQNLSNGKGEVTGGLIDHVFRPPLYESFFDFKPEGPIARIASMAYSETSGIYWLDVLEKQIFESRGKKVFKAFIVNTDIIAHTKGLDGIYRYLSELDKKINQLRAHFKEKFHQELEVILVSDHGNAFLKPKSVNVDQTLTEDGWTLTSTLENDRDVVVVIPEILSFAPFFVKPTHEATLAKSLSRTVGVHVSLFLSAPDQVDFLSHAGRWHTRANFDQKNKKIRYQVLKGQDPFGHFKFFKGHEVSYAKYFQESLATDYPNAIVRALEGLTQNSTQKPSVLVSPILGYVFSNKTLELVTKIMGLESVHGSFHRTETLGIFVSTDRELPPVSPSDVLDFVH